MCRVLNDALRDCLFFLARGPRDVCDVVRCHNVATNCGQHVCCYAILDATRAGAGDGVLERVDNDARANAVAMGVNDMLEFRPVRMMTLRNAKSLIRLTSKRVHR